MAFTSNRTTPISGWRKVPTPLLGAHRPKQQYPSLMQSIQQVERKVNRRRRGVRQMRPGVFVVWLDRGFVFGSASLKRM